MREMLEAQYGIDSAFTGHLAPLLESFEASALSAKERARLLQSVIAAYRYSQRPTAFPAEEVRALLEDVEAEFRKIDESLKVLGVYLLRICRTLRSETFKPVVH
jgi:hypothetical protein